MNVCTPHTNGNISTATKHICKQGEILRVTYASRSCSKGSWDQMNKFAADECLNWGVTQFYDTGVHCPRPTGLPSLAPYIAGQRAKPVAVNPSAVIESSATMNTNFNANMSHELITLPFVTKLVEENKNYLSDNCGGGDPDNLNWEMPSAIFFVTTIVTTIGYGTFAPTTDGGKIFTVVFAFIGIAYFGMVVGLVGTEVVRAIQKTAKCCCHRKQKKYKLTGKKTLLWTILIMMIYIAVIGIGCLGIGWGAGDGMYCKFVFLFVCFRG